MSVSPHASRDCVTAESSPPGHSARAIVAASASFREILNQTARYAPLKDAVLLSGETGTGKDVVAHEIHRLSGRSGAFVHVNCGGISETLLESELFGHEKGSFTGAINRHRGSLERAHDGTLFLDEIADLGMSAQAALLVFLDHGIFSRVGGETEIQGNVRVVAATNANLKERVQLGKFRKDLLARLNRLALVLPPLRTRLDDVAALARHFARLRNVNISEDAVAYLQSLPLEENARELDTRILRVAASGKEIVTAEALREIEPTEQPFTGCPPPAAEDRGISLTEGTMIYRLGRIAGAMRRSGGRVAEAAKALGVTRQALHELIQKYREHPLLSGIEVRKT
ncbi:MAG: sigma 54-interacting transcriptional regulator [Planctomycetes bacterium]|nr:sigma 54-interacting transcriptional regulator [Planctomycetota bacterium]